MFYPNGLSSIGELHLEISSRCNAACPQCPRNLYGYPYNDGYIERDLTLEEIKKIFPVNFVQQLWLILINGNFGDIVMNSESLDILSYFREHNPRAKLMVTTNGGARDQNFWKELATLGCEVKFCLEGIDNHTHALYRQNTLYSTVLKNAQTFIAAGGEAIWKMIEFEHNLHQIDQACQLSKDLGFVSFELINHGRDVGPVFDKQGKIVHIMRSEIWKNNGLPTELEEAIKFRQNNEVKPNRVNVNIKPRIECQILKTKSIYVSSTGHVYPCCWLGIAPETYGHGCYMQGANTQLRELIYENNALEYSLEHCIKWFDRVKESWPKNSIQEGRLILCNDNCGCSN